MPLIELAPVIDSLAGIDNVAATFYAEAKHAKNPAVRVDGSAVTFPARLVYNWDGTQWDEQPQLSVLPIGCYWDVTLISNGARLRRTVVVVTADDVVAFGDLAVVVPDTASVDTQLSTLAAANAYAASLLAAETAIAAQVSETAATLSAQVSTVQAQIDQNTDLQGVVLGSAVTAEQAALSAAASAAAAQAAVANIAAPDQSLINAAALTAVIAALADPASAISAALTASHRPPIFALTQSAYNAIAPDPTAIYLIEPDPIQVATVIATPTGDGYISFTGSGVVPTGDGYISLSGTNVTSTGDGYSSIT